MLHQTTHFFWFFIRKKKLICKLHHFKSATCYQWFAIVTPLPVPTQVWPFKDVTRHLERWVVHICVCEGGIVTNAHLHQQCPFVLHKEWLAGIDLTYGFLAEADSYVGQALSIRKEFFWLGTLGTEYFDRMALRQSSLCRFEKSLWPGVEYILNVVVHALWTLAWWSGESHLRYFDTRSRGILNYLLIRSFNWANDLNK